MSLTQSLAANRPSIWMKDVMANVAKESFFYANGMISTKAGRGIVLEKNDFTQKKGGTINFALTGKLSGSGVDGDATLSGNGEAITSYNFNASIYQKRQLVELTGLYDEQLNAYDMRADARDKISIWMAEFLDTQFFLKAAGITTLTLTDINGDTYSADATWGNTPNIVPAADEAAGIGARYVCADTAGLDSLASTDVMTAALIEKAKLLAQTSNNPKVRPIKVKGKDYYCMVMHPSQMDDLRNASSSIFAQQLREAQVRGGDNPIFTGAEGMLNGVLLYTNEKVPRVSSGSKFSTGGTAATADAFRALLLGADALVFGRAGDRKNDWVEKDDIDYNNRFGVATRFLGVIDKPYFNSVDYGVIAVDSSATNSDFS
jgi:N4-gp56 family major capsid protein